MLRIRNRDSLNSYIKTLSYHRNLMSLSNVSSQRSISSPLTLPLDSCCRTIACFFCSNVGNTFPPSASSAVCIARFIENFLCAVFKVHLPLPYCHTCLVPSKSTKRFFKEPGSHLLSHAVSSIVPSAAQVLTIVFGMGTGVSPERIATRKGFESLTAF